MPAPTGWKNAPLLPHPAQYVGVAQGEPIRRRRLAQACIGKKQIHTYVDQARSGDHIWQFAFLRAFHACFERPLDVEKWWALFLARTETEERVHLIQSVVEQGFSAVLITSGEVPDPRVVYTNPAFARVTGYSRD